ncbi:MAG TPA: menaquinone biosynthesis decarboxylase [Planctomycetota bacterium]|nr:menaquinone biosynthesis decarboxylase [Planctomycetota bacterium]
MPFDNLREFLRAIEAKGELLRVKEKVSPILEISEWTDRVVKKNGPALLFENVEGSSMPVAINLFGTPARTAMALGVDDLNKIGDEIQALLHQRPPESIVEKLKMIPLLMKIANFPPRKVKSAPCQEVVYADEKVDLSMLPALKCWPDDGGRYFTLTNVFTKDPKGLPNCGMYRIQIFDRNTCAMHWHMHHDGARHFREWEKLGKRMPVAVAIGGDPAVVYAATAPMPPGIDEMFLAGFIRKRPVEMVPCVSQPDLFVPAEAEIILEGYLQPGERRREGPFGDHTGFYSLADDYPVFHITAITTRKNPIYQTIVVGTPPMEDTYLGKATERIFLPFLKLTLPEINDYNLPEFGVFHNCAIFSIKKSYPQHARKLMHAIWGLGQIMFTKIIIVVDEGVNVQNLDEVFHHVGTNCDFSRDVEIVKGPTDILDHASQHYGWTGKIGIDATRKWKDEGITRSWPETIPVDESAKKRALDERAALPALIKSAHPDITAANVRPFGDYTHWAFIATRKSAPHNARKVLQALWSLEQSRSIKAAIIVDENVDVQDQEAVLFHVGANCDFCRDVEIVKGAAEPIDHASQTEGEVGKLGIDATKKLKDEGFVREWPDYIVMSDEVKRKVAEQMKKVGLA